MKIIQKKSLGQNFLVDQNVLDKISEVGDVGKSDSVIEVGPGKGALTNNILKKKTKMSSCY